MGGSKIVRKQKGKRPWGRGWVKKRESA